jgi:uncharacterized protein (TIGR04255 family)
MSFDLVTTFPTLHNAPIAEAVIDIRVKRRPDITLQEIEAFGVGLEDELPKRTEQRSLKARIDMSEPGNARLIGPSSTEPDGYVFQSSDQRLIVQASFDGLTLSRLKPYQKWSAFVEQASRFWQLYVKVTRPSRVERLGVRYINRIQVEPGLDIFGFVLTGPQIAMALPQTMIDFFLRLVIPDESGAVAIINEMFGVPEEGESARPLIFDIDAVRNVDMQPESLQEILGGLEDLRRFKNRIFFNSLTAQALERYRS